VLFPVWFAEGLGTVPLRGVVVFTVLFSTVTVALTMVEFWERSVSACLFDEVVVVDEFDEDEEDEDAEVDEFDEFAFVEDEEEEDFEVVFVNLEEDAEGEGTFDEVEFVEDELEDDAEGEGTFDDVEFEEEDGEGEGTFEDVLFWHKFDWVSFTMAAREG